MVAPMLVENVFTVMELRLLVGDWISEKCVILNIK